MFRDAKVTIRTVCNNTQNDGHIVIFCCFLLLFFFWQLFGRIPNFEKRNYCDSLGGKSVTENAHLLIRMIFSGSPN